MNQRHDEHELLALIEGELPLQDASRMRERLARSEPELLALIERMRADRDALRSAPEPELPEDFLAEVEPVLARPMLIPPADEVRRRHRRRQVGRRPLAPILLAAAAVALFAGAATWATLFVLGRTTGPATPNVGGAARDLAQREAVSVQAPEVVNPPPSQAPEMLAERTVDPGTSPKRLTSPPKPVGPPPSEPVVAKIALVIETSDAGVVEGLLQTILAGIDPKATALVRNLDQAEADALTDQWHQSRARGGARGAEPPVAGSGALPGSRRAAESGPRRELPPLDRSVLRSRQLAGPAELAPSYEQQLVFSGKGATHTIAVPAEKLAALLEVLASDGGATTLRLLDGAEGDVPWSAYGDVRRAAAELLEHARGGVILLPVEVRPAR